jgi:hypothetical protein
MLASLELAWVDVLKSRTQVKIDALCYVTSIYGTITERIVVYKLIFHFRFMEGDIGISLRTSLRPEHNPGSGM